MSKQTHDQIAEGLHEALAVARSKPMTDDELKALATKTLRYNEEHAAFIAAAREAIPRLLAEKERLRTALRYIDDGSRSPDAMTAAATLDRMNVTTFRTDADRLRMIAAAVMDDGLSDGAFRGLVRAQLFPVLLSREDMVWAMTEARKIEARSVPKSEMRQRGAPGVEE